MKRIILIVATMLLFPAIKAQEVNETQSTDSTTMDSLWQTLPEVMVKGERPVVKMQEGKLVYDLPQLIEGKAVDNVYESLKHLPGVVENDGSFQLAGRSVTVILDDKVTTMNAEQFMSYLKSIPASRIEKAEVLFNAPARYQVRGAVINIKLRRVKERTLQGEAFGKYMQEHDATFQERTGLLFSTGLWSTDFLYSHTHGDFYHTSDKEAIHTLDDGTRHDILTGNYYKSRSHEHSVRLGNDLNFGEKHQLSLVYSGSYLTSHGWSVSHGTSNSEAKDDGEKFLHNIRMDYLTPFGLKAGADYTYYNTPEQQLINSNVLGQRLDFRTDDGQRINKVKLYLGQEHSLGKGWMLNYGVNYTNILDNTHQLYYDPATGHPMTTLADVQSRRREENLNLYAGFSKSFGNKLTLDASLAEEHYKSAAWSRWNVYPTLNITYLPADGHLLQVSMSSDTQYPQLWAMQTMTSYRDSYSIVEGNPLLRPSNSYSFQFVYLLKNKYMLAAWANRSNRDFMQTLYQASDRLQEVFRFVNFDRTDMAGLQLSAPFKAGRWYDGRLSLNAVWQRQIDSDFYDIPFDRKGHYLGIVSNNTFTLSTTPDLKFTLYGRAFTRGGIQGTYDLHGTSCIDASLRYGFAKGRGILSLWCNDVFQKAGISPCINYADQFVINRWSYFREVGASFTWRFGGYKEKQREEVDKSRFK